MRGSGSRESLPSKPRAHSRGVRGGSSPATTVPRGATPQGTRGQCWRPKPLPSAGDLREWFADHQPLLPKPPPPRHSAGANTSTSSRLKRRTAVLRQAACFIATLNSPDEGRCHRNTVASHPSQHWKGREAWAQLHSVALREASRLERARWSLGSTGVTTLAARLKSFASDDYTIRERTTFQIPTIASSTDGPS